jgi:hypothetical protein
MRILTVTFSFLLLIACATPRSEIVSKTDAFTPTHAVEMFMDPPKRPHKTFAILEDNWGGTPEEINARLIERAREIGADAIWITGVREKTNTEWMPTHEPFFYGRRYFGPRYYPVTRYYRSVQAKALKYTAPP